MYLISYHYIPSGLQYSRIIIYYIYVCIYMRPCDNQSNCLRVLFIIFSSVWTFFSSATHTITHHIHIVYIYIYIYDTLVRQTTRQQPIKGGKRIYTCVRTFIQNLYSTHYIVTPSSEVQ